MNKIKNWQDFFNLAKRMRVAQKEFFKTKSSSMLGRSKELEREFDAAIRQIDSAQAEAKQPKLF